MSLFCVDKDSYNFALYQPLNRNIMKKIIVTAVMAIALMAGSATVSADNTCKKQCTKTEQCAKPCDKKKDCKKAECTKPCDKKKDCKKAECTKKTECPKQKKECTKKQNCKKACNKK